MFTGRKSQIVLENLNIRLIISLIKQGHQFLEAGWIQLLGNEKKNYRSIYKKKTTNQTNKQKNYPNIIDLLCSQIIAGVCDLPECMAFLCFH